MFEKINKKFTKKFVDDAKEVIKEEASQSIERRMPIILNVVVLGMFLLTFVGPKKKPTVSNITINNYYLGGYNHD